MHELSDATLSKSEIVYRDLRDRIISGRFTPGYRIVLGKIATELGVSTVPVREAIRRLEAEKLVTFTPNVGAEVASIDVHDYADAMQTLAVLEGAGTALAAARITRDQLEQASATNNQMRMLAEGNFDPRLFTDLNQRFHQQLCAACPNQYLTEILDREWERVAVIRRNTFAFEPARSLTSVHEHDHIVTLIRSGAGAEEVEHAARQHKLRALNQFMQSRPAS
ncbi:GntR family transcriptional regulator [Bowdeniella nasicola]|uniref:GntR family transcriptional regulator n=1 Tax=Bowdeniella nasicola TaxID=208480 RepID=A0A1Q5Q296_9ACTO|nr:GntR family transcriptional regulator [Bowdeniella nasicola]OKL53916.1 GntR family transcriptional regulator [Bowdeniella nasicola]